MFESLTDRFEGILTRLRSRGRLTEADVDEVLREIRTALLEADVEIGVVRGFTEAVRARCVGLELSQALSPGQQVIKIVNEELVAILGGETLKITYAGRPPDGDPPGRPAGLGQDHHLGQAGPLVQAAGAQPAAGRRRPPAPGGRRAAPGAGRPGRHHRVQRADRSGGRGRAPGSRRPDAWAGTS